MIYKQALFAGMVGLVFLACLPLARAQPSAFETCLKLDDTRAVADSDFCDTDPRICEEEARFERLSGAKRKQEEERLEKLREDRILCFEIAAKAEKKAPVITINEGDEFNNEGPVNTGEGSIVEKKTTVNIGNTGGDAEYTFLKLDGDLFKLMIPGAAVFFFVIMFFRRYFSRYRQKS